MPRVNCTVRAFCFLLSLLNLSNIFFKALVNCRDLGSPFNGQKLGSRFWTGESVSFICNPGYRLIGPASRMCLPSGKWSGEQPLCVVGKRHLVKLIMISSYLILSYLILS